MKFTDHILIRYCERVMGIDLKLIKKILSKSIGKEDGAHLIPGTNFYVVVRNKTAITIIEKGEYLKKPKTKEMKSRAKEKSAFNHILELAQTE